MASVVAQWFVILKSRVWISLDGGYFSHWYWILNHDGATSLISLGCPTMQLGTSLIRTVYVKMSSISSQSYILYTMAFRACR